MTEDSLLILFSLNITDDLFVSESLTTPCILFNNYKRNAIKAFVNTEATEYTFINETTVHIICENFEISLISLVKPKSVKDFDEHLTKQLITFVIYSDLTV